MSKFRILWLEDDYLDSFEAALEAKGFCVERAYFVSDAVELLDNTKYDLLLLDVMIPIEPDDAKYGFNKESTNGGNQTGLLFYERFGNRLRELNLPVLVYTIRGDEADLKDAFVALGLPPSNFMYKVAASNVNTLISEVERVLRHRTPIEDTIGESV